MAQSNQFVPLTLGLIEEGEMMQGLEKEFERMQVGLCNHVDKWEGRAEGATAELVLKVKVKCVDTEERIFQIDAVHQTKMPPRPPKRTKAIQCDDRGVPLLFVRSTGSTPADHPLQMHLPMEQERTEDQPREQEEAK